MDELKLERLDLPGGGWVEFNDPEMVKGRDIDRMRAAWQGSRIAGEALNVSMQIAAEVLIAAWNLPALPNAPVPGDTPQFWGEVGWRTKKAIEAHIAQAVAELCGFATAAAAVSPQPPASA